MSFRRSVVPSFRRSVVPSFRLSLGLIFAFGGPACDGENEGENEGDSGEVEEDSNFVRIAASTFEMGCTEGQEGDDECGAEPPPHDVTLTHDYYVGITEVTRGQFSSVMGYDSSESEGDDCGPDCPAEEVDWHEAAAYANELSREAHLTECYECDGRNDGVACEQAMVPYACDGYRLLTEAEWEGAARCGTDLRFAGSDDSEDVAWTNANSGDESHPVGSLDANGCGLYDMSGSVWEWAHDWYADYDDGPATDPWGPESDSKRVNRSGSWSGNEYYAQVATRSGDEPKVNYSGVGFRVGRSIP